MRYAAKIDDNQTEIVKALRKLGCSVVLLHRAGKGIPDLLVGFRGRTILMEVKTKNGKLNHKQQNFRDEWRGDPVHVVRSPGEAIKAVVC